MISTGCNIYSVTIFSVYAVYCPLNSRIIYTCSSIIWIGRVVLVDLTMLDFIDVLTDCIVLLVCVTFCIVTLVELSTLAAAADPKSITANANVKTRKKILLCICFFIFTPK